MHCTFINSYSVILQKEKLLPFLEENGTFSKSLLMHTIFVTTHNFALLTTICITGSNLIKWKMLQFLGT